MNTFSTRELYGSIIEELWNNPEYNVGDPVLKNIKDRGFAVQDLINYGGLMFVGINPSYKVGVDKPGFCFYTQDFKYIHKYFKKYPIISEAAGLPWSHIDLLFIRETNQNVIKNAKRNEKFLEFQVLQYVIAKDIIRRAKPDVLIVNNTEARDWLLNDPAIKHLFVFNEELGTHKIVGGDLAGTPVFFTSMLTGQRALDNGSYERLIWHIKFVLKKIRG